ncbi:hypothetical protein GALMADRAFT_146143 [Galerina marginata CBS 339.88]|uniref:DUF6535 domain-containing protein n=1 Tax=Galerina marginata (strain CBS 339.88) TaxID=685588 RepID=A0A067SFN1_GALM3|nr:hypothetical protein GALMADRAFT_146143 [Galerina marginata CBS 339.88]
MSVHSSTGPEEVLPDEQTQEEKQPELPKIWDLDDDFLYATPKPDRDPWSILLEPLMKKDETQCNAWKEEAQNPDIHELLSILLSILASHIVNLHIIMHKAGLFSAVVTAFIIESYKTLKPDPNNTIISLLSIIANRLDNTTTPIPVLLSPTGSVSHSSPARPSIRINQFWLISLVLSLRLQHSLSC